MKKRDIMEYDELIPHLGYITKKKDLKAIKEAYDYAAVAHNGQFRQSGEPYVTHPLNVALILASLNFDANCIIAGLLHDVVEDTDATIEDIINEFGDEVASLIDNLSKIEQIKFNNKSEQLANYQRKLLVSLVEDPRIIIIKLCDRLHNMRTLGVCSVEKQKRVATETLEIYTPLAHRLGIYNIKSELEDLSLRYLEPEKFYDIAEKLSAKKIEREENVNIMIEDVKKLLNDNNISHSIKGRAKSIYSIHKKLDKGKRFADIYDLLALRIVVDELSDCYLCLGLIHSKYKLLSNRFKDYISQPKINMYQSLHTVVFGSNGQLFEVQIRTKKMDQIAEDGIASHWAYKEDKSKTVIDHTELKLQFFKSIIELDNDTNDTMEFINNIKDDVLTKKSIYIYTPKGDVFELPVGSTPIDFAYKIHTDIGNKMTSALVNGSIVGFDYQLQTSDIIQIKTNSNSSPNSDWLNIAKTSGAKNKIRSYFFKINKEEILTKNKDILDKVLKEHNIDSKEFYNNKNLKKTFKLCKVRDLNELLLSFNGKNTPLGVINKYKDKVLRPNKQLDLVVSNRKKDTSKSVIIAGNCDMNISFAQCCLPIPGDNIIGYVSSGKGIVIHRKSCHNSLDIEDKIIDVEWNLNHKGNFSTTLLVETVTNTKNLINLLSIMNNYDIALKTMKTIKEENPTIYELDVLVANKEVLDKFIAVAYKNKNIKNIDRMKK